MKKLFLQISFLALAAHSSFLVSGFSGFAAEQQHDTYVSQRNAGIDGTTPAATACPVCPTVCSNSNNTTTYYVPSFYVQICDSTNKILNNQSSSGYLFPSLQSPPQFNLENTVFSVHIFAPSNAITSTKVITKSADSSYVVAYCLKDPAGSLVHTEFQTFSSQTFPHQIILTPNLSIPAPTANETSPQPSSWNPSGTTTSGLQMIAQSTFIPTTTSLTPLQKQQIINGISPISQKFLFTQDGSSMSAIRISGTFDADSSTATLTNTTSPFGSTAATGTNTTPIGQLSIAFAGSTLLTFQNISIPFTHSDLDQGLLLNVCIFQTDSGASYPVIATLRTMDGLKMHKQMAIPIGTTSSSVLGSTPTNIMINYLPTPTASSAALSLLTTSFLSSVATSQAFTILGPINLRFVIFRTKSTTPGGSQFMVNMM